MKKTRKPALAVLAVAAAAAVVCATAAVAFAGIIETPARGLVYDDTYGVIYEDYALMRGHETVSTDTGDQKTVTTYDIVDAMGNITLSTGESRDLTGAGFLSGKDTETKEYYVHYGFLNVRKTGQAAQANSGLYSVDGSCVADLKYDSFTLEPNKDYIIASVCGTDGAMLEIYDVDSCESLDTIAVTDDACYWCSVSTAKTYLKVEVYLGTPSTDAQRLTKYYDLIDGKYVERAGSASVAEVSGVVEEDVEADLDDTATQRTSKIGAVNGTDVYLFIERDSQKGTILRFYAADVNGNEVKIGNYTIAVSTMHVGSNVPLIQHGDEDFYFAKDANGKFGAIDSKGNVIIPFEYEGIYEGVAETGSDYIMAKKDGAYYFVKAVADPEVKAGENPVQGKDRYETAAKIATTAYPEGSVGAVVSTGMNFPDALAASSLAGALDWPIVLTDGTAGSLDAAAKGAIADLGATKFVVVGGTNTVSQGIFDELDELGAVSRVSGGDRYKTAEAIYDAASGAWSETCIVATGYSYPDALSISGYANSTKTPIFLSNPETGLTAETIADIEAGGFKSAVIVGGKNAVPEAVEQQLAECGLESDAVKRLEGVDRYATSAKIATFSLENGFKPDGACIATGANFPDALAGGVLAGRLGTIMLLGSDSDTSAFSVLNGKDVKSLIFLGGENTVTSTMRAAAKEAAGLE